MSEQKQEAPAAAPAAGGGGIKAMLPLILTVVLMPVLAYAMTAFVLVPKLKSATGAPTEEAPTGDAEKSADGKTDTAAGGASKASERVQIAKILVNVAGTGGTRYLMTSLTLVGEKKDFKDVIEDKKDQLLDVANNALGAKTIPDLEKPGARNQIRSELMTVFNHALGSDLVKEIYITEMAIQ